MATDLKHSNKVSDEQCTALFEIKIECHGNIPQPVLFIPMNSSNQKNDLTKCHGVPLTYPTKCCFVKKDGNSFYRCLALALRGTSSHYRKMRDELAEYILEAEDFQLQDLGYDGNSRLLIVSNIRKDGEWADRRSISAAAHAFKIKIAIYQLENDEKTIHHWVIFGPYNPLTALGTVYLRRYRQRYFELITQVHVPTSPATTLESNDKAKDNKGKVSGEVTDEGLTRSIRQETVYDPIRNNPLHLLDLDQNDACFAESQLPEMATDSKQSNKVTDEEIWLKPFPIEIQKNFPGPVYFDPLRVSNNAAVVDDDQKPLLTYPTKFRYTKNDANNFFRCLALAIDDNESLYLKIRIYIGDYIAKATDSQLELFGYNPKNRDWDVWSIQNETMWPDEKTISAAAHALNVNIAIYKFIHGKNPINYWKIVSPTNPLQAMGTVYLSQTQLNRKQPNYSLITQVHVKAPTNASATTLGSPAKSKDNNRNFSGKLTDKGHSSKREPEIDDPLEDLSPHLVYVDPKNIFFNDEQLSPQSNETLNDPETNSRNNVKKNERSAASSHGVLHYNSDMLKEVEELKNDIDAFKNDTAVTVNRLKDFLQQVEEENNKWKEIVDKQGAEIDNLKQLRRNEVTVQPEDEQMGLMAKAFSKIDHLTSQLEQLKQENNQWKNSVNENQKIIKNLHQLSSDQDKNHKKYSQFQERVTKKINNLAERLDDMTVSDEESEGGWIARIGKNRDEIEELKKTYVQNQQHLTKAIMDSTTIQEMLKKDFDELKTKSTAQLNFLESQLENEKNENNEWKSIGLRNQEEIKHLIDQRSRDVDEMTLFTAMINSKLQDLQLQLDREKQDSNKWNRLVHRHDVEITALKNDQNNTERLNRVEKELQSLSLHLAELQARR